MKKNSEIQILIKKLLAKYRFFKKLPEISHIQKNRKFSSIIVISLDQLLLPYKFYGGSMKGILFFNFASCEPLNEKQVKQVYVKEAKAQKKKKKKKKP